MKFIVSQIISLVASFAFGYWMKNPNAGLFMWCLIEAFYLGIDQIVDAIDGM